MLDSVKTRLLELQDSRYRYILAAGLSAYKTVKTRELTIIRKDGDGDWRHRAGRLVIASPKLHMKDVHAIVDEVADLWMHGYTPRPGDVVFDVGAGIGEDSLAFSRLVGSEGRVVAIEAHPRTYRCLAKTVRASHLSNVLPLDCALFSSDGHITISDGPAHVENTVLDPTETGVRITSRSIDSLVRELRLTRIDLLKMNIEGAEVAALEGMRDSVSLVRHVAISCHDFVADRGGPAAMRTKARVIELLKERGFTLAQSRAESPYPWVRDYVYARGAAEGEPPGFEQAYLSASA